MKKTIIAAALALLFGAHSASAFGIFDNLNYQARLGYNIGGTMPMGMPASIRGPRWTFYPLQEFDAHNRHINSPAHDTEIPVVQEYR